VQKSTRPRSSVPVTKAEQTIVNKHGHKHRHKGVGPYENHSHQRSVVSEQ
jgi:hypothetical protein